jgi:hypothetical protein
MWTSKPPRYPQLTEEECDELVRQARIEKGRRLYDDAYAKRIKGEREFPRLDAKAFRELILKRGQARSADENWDQPFAIDADNEAVVKILALYFTRDDRFASIAPGYSLNKGLYLVGDMGVGKTKLMDACDINPYACYVRNDCQLIAGEYEDKKEGGQAVIDYYSANAVPVNTDATFGQQVQGRFYDDLGQESISRHFGKDKNVMGSIIENRYRMGAYQLTHFTSNLTLDQLGALYGPRVPDRLWEMCNVIEFPVTAKSRRGQTARVAPDRITSDRVALDQA